MNLKTSLLAALLGGSMLLQWPLAAQETPEAGTTREDSRLHHDVVFVTGQDVVLKENETAEAVVVLGGSAKILGKVEGAVVAVWGNVNVQGEVRDAAVAVLGNVEAGPHATINGEAVAVGGEVNSAEGAVVHGHTQSVTLPRWFTSWVGHCVFMARPLAPQVGWLWVLTGAIFLLYLVVAALFARPIAVCVGELNQRPATTFVIGFLSLFLVPLALLILTATGIGLIVVPFALAAVCLGFVVGKVAFLEWIGMRVGSQLGGGFLQKPLEALVLGTVIVVLLYMVPVLGLILFGIITVWGLGAAVIAAFTGFRKELPERPKSPPPSEPAPLAAGVPSVGAAAAAAAAPAGASEGATPAFVHIPAPPVVSPSAPPVVPEMLSYPRARFWERVGAGFLDLVLVGIVSSLAGERSFGLVVALAYFAGIWAWRGTSVGGIVLGLKVVREDGQPVTFAVALVRSLAAAFSIIVLFLGFLWIAWDPERQGWHDKIAGTVVLKLPKGTPLV